jgi:hypothetical protein
VVWLYFVCWNTDETPRLIVRRNSVPSPSIPGAASWGPVIELLSRDEGWVPRPSLLTRFFDADYLDQATLEEARAAAEAAGVPWPMDPPPSYAADVAPTVAHEAGGRETTAGRGLRERQATTVADRALSRHLPPEDPDDPDPSFASPGRATSG